MNVGIVMPNLAALRAAFFTLSGKNLKGGGRITATPPSVRGLRQYIYLLRLFDIHRLVPVASGHFRQIDYDLFLSLARLPSKRAFL